MRAAARAALGRGYNFSVDKRALPAYTDTNESVDVEIKPENALAESGRRWKARRKRPGKWTTERAMKGALRPGVSRDGLRPLARSGCVGIPQSPACARGKNKVAPRKYALVPSLWTGRGFFYPRAQYTI